MDVGYGVAVWSSSTTISEPDSSSAPVDVAPGGVANNADWGEGEGTPSSAESPQASIASRTRRTATDFARIPAVLDRQLTQVMDSSWADRAGSRTAESKNLPDSE